MRKISLVALEIQKGKEWKLKDSTNEVQDCVLQPKMTEMKSKSHTGQVMQHDCKSCTLA